MDLQTILKPDVLANAYKVVTHFVKVVEENNKNSTVTGDQKKAEVVSLASDFYMLLKDFVAIPADIDHVINVAIPILIDTVVAILNAIGVFTKATIPAKV